MNETFLLQTFTLFILISACASPSARGEAHDAPATKETQMTAPTAINKKNEIHNLALNENNVDKIKNLFTFGEAEKPCGVYDDDGALETRSVNGKTEYLLASSDYNDVQVWDLEKETKIQTLPNVDADSILFYPDQKTLVTFFAHDLSKLTLWDIQTGNQRQQFVFDADYLRTGVSYDGQISVSRDGLNVALFVATQKETFMEMFKIERFRIEEFNLQTKQMRDTGYDLPIYYEVLPPYVYSPKGNLVSVTYGYDDRLHFLDLTNHKDTVLQLPFLTFDEALSSGAVIATISIDSSETYVAGGAHNGNIYVWDTADGVLLQSFKAHQTGLSSGWIDGVDSLEFSPESNLLVSVGYDNFTKLWDANTGVLLKEINTCHRFVGFTQDGRYLVMIGEKGIEVWGIP
jgi:WD40 repeat protein